MSASAEDMGHYLIAQMNEGRYRGESVLSPEGVTTLHTPGPNTEAPSSPLAGGAGGSYAMGWVDGKVHGVPAVWHNGDDSRNGSLMVMSKSGWGMALLVNSSNPLSELEPTQYILSGVTRLLDGKEPALTVMPSIGRTYLVVDSVMLVLTVPILVAAVRLPWWYKNLRRQLPMRRWWRTALTVLRGVAEMLAAIAILLTIPRLYASWSLLTFGVPDLAWWLLAASAIILMTGLVHSGLFARALTRSKARG